MAGGGIVGITRCASSDTSISPGGKLRVVSIKEAGNVLVTGSLRSGNYSRLVIVLMIDSFVISPSNFKFSTTYFLPKICSRATKTSFVLMFHKF